MSCVFVGPKASIHHVSHFLRGPGGTRRPVCGALSPACPHPGAPWAWPYSTGSELTHTHAHTDIHRQIFTHTQFTHTRKHTHVHTQTFTHRDVLCIHALYSILPERLVKQTSPDRDLKTTDARQRCCNGTILYSIVKVISFRGNDVDLVFCFLNQK